MPDTIPRPPADRVIGVQALLAQARDQEGIDQLWSLSVASQVLRERQAPPGPLNWIDGRLRDHVDGYARGRDVPVPPAIIDTLADLARDRG
jgi:hypothetical protein